MENKSAPLVEIKTNSTPGEFTAVISAIGNVDSQGDRVMPDAFKEAIENDPVPPVYWAHKHDIPPIGEGLDWKEQGNEVHFSGRLFVKGDVEHQMANMVYAGMKSYQGRAPAIRQWSYTYGIPEGGAEQVMEDGKAVRLLHTIRPVAEVGPCFLGANPETRTVAAAKGLDLSALSTADTSQFDFFQLGAKAEWTPAYVDALPDSAFLYVEEGGTRDASAKTSPRSLRHFPYKNAHGSLDMPHLRDAISRAPEASTIPEEARTQVLNRAKRLLAAQEGKALLLGAIYSSKAWNDVEGYAVWTLLDMLDSAVSYIQNEPDPGDVAQMQTIARSLLTLLQIDFGEASAAKAALATAVELYGAAAEATEVLSDGGSTVLSKEIAHLLFAVPSIT